jgi:prepilin-type N-terminal cleavage/methylation domain-containing protein
MNTVIRKSETPDSRSPAGFTLPEVLIVIAIIAVLALVSIVATTKLREKAHSTKCVGNLRQMGTLIGLYVGENNGYLPPSAADATYGWSHWHSPLPVLAQVGEGYTTRVWFDRPGDHHIFNCPSQKKCHRTYTANTHLMAFRPGGGRFVSYASISQPGRKILIADSRETGTGSGPGYFSKPEQIGDRHDGHSNVLYASFSVGSVKPNQVDLKKNLKP